MSLYRIGGGRSRIVKAGTVELKDKKFRINPPEGWEEEEAQREAEEEAKRAEEKQKLLDLEMLNIAELRKREVDAVNALKEQIVSEAQNNAKRIESQARSASDILMRDTIIKAEAEKEKIHNEARQAGFIEGSTAGATEGEKLKKEARQILEDAKAERQEMIDKLEPELVDIIAGIGERLLHKKAAFNPQVILHLIRAGLAGITSTDASGEISVLVSEDDYETVLENKEELLKVVGGSTKLDIVKDPKLNKSDCVVKTDFGFIDTSLTQSFEELKENLYLISAGESGDSL